MNCGDLDLQMDGDKFIKPTNFSISFFVHFDFFDFSYTPTAILTMFFVQPKGADIYNLLIQCGCLQLPFLVIYLVLVTKKYF